MVIAKEQEISFLCDNQSICAAPVLYTDAVPEPVSFTPSMGLYSSIHLNRTESRFTSS